MKRQASIIFTSLMMGLCFNTIASYQAIIPVDHIYVPHGFDSNDNTEVVIEGYLPNLCYRSPRASVQVVGNEIKIKMTSLRAPDSSACAEMVVPYVRPVSVGTLPAGDYKILVNEGEFDSIKSNIQVAPSPSQAIDNFVYAYVDYLEVDESGRVFLNGHNPSDCFVLDRVEFYDNKKDTYSVLPIMKQIADICPQRIMPFRYEIQVPDYLKSDKVLLHTRSMNGMSVNTLYFKNGMSSLL